MNKRLNTKTKLLTIGAIASFAALPITGVFAATGTTVTDTVEVTINSACTITTNNASNTYSATMTNSQLKSDLGSTAMTINCNDAGGWHVTAVGTGADTTNKHYMNASGSGTDIATGTATSGDTSNWAMKVTGTGANGFTTFSAVPSSATDVAYGDSSVAGAVLNTMYQVWISPTQQADTYTGQVTYTLSHPYTPPQQNYIMQEVSTWKNSLQTGDEVTATDSRDGKTYTVAKLADGNIWMTQNLDFDIVNGGANLDSTNTDVPANWADAGNLTNTYATNDTAWDYSYTAPESYDPGTLYWNGLFPTEKQADCEASGGTWSGSSCSGYNATSSTGNNHYHLGNYYNWTAAVAMSDSSGYTTDGVDVDQSICPSGWRLPTYSGNKSYQNLASAESLTSGTSGNIQNSPVYFVYSGVWVGGSYNVGSRGYYWFSVAGGGGGDYAYRLYFDVYSDLLPQNNEESTNGCSLRCVAR